MLKTLLVVRSSFAQRSQLSSGRRLKACDAEHPAHDRKDSGHFANLASPKGEGFQPSPMGRLNLGVLIQQLG
jgi:hypothetical protein